ncbi:MAG: hypothetical protein AAF206_15380 [Bacteroidota bacterium]
MKTLHILNGEGTAHPFRTSGIEGDLLIWHEALMDGPVHHSLFGEEFWRARQTFWGASDEKMRSIRVEMGKIHETEAYGHIILWFEYDLFCQINMIAALHLLSQSSHQPTISLVSPGAHEAIEDFRGMGQLSPEHFPPLLEEAVRLTAEDLQFAAVCWEVFQQQDATKLATLTEHTFPVVFPYLKTALYNHLKRFPSTHNGLSAVEECMLKILGLDLSSFRNWIGQCLRAEDGWLGMGDLQYIRLAEGLGPLYMEDKQGIRINPVGMEVLRGERDFAAIRKQPQWLGGAQTSDFRWDGEKLIPQL